MAVEAPFRTEVVVSGLTCQHCVMSITEELEEITGVGSVDVALNDRPEGSTVTIRSTRELDPAEIAAAVAVAGYAVVS
ncbi:Copper chaperone CopZ [Pseudonocardia thermophila]|uniref:Copper chaperone CopZ n=1 Tax=Pseudonocardia thermophila TaxID=1848 RepID=A0A1M6YM03_PSETH|nr:cation transporter [Pseudonocardia thermophila]SHL19140.1 Copper chaperone CopZ [Pseudonocardia thermophila]